MKIFGIAETVFDELILLFSQNPNIEKVALFGSRAMGKYKEGSDIDLALFGENVKLNDQLDLTVKLEKLGYPYVYDFQIHKNLKDKNVLDHIDRVGIIIYQKESVDISKWKKCKLGEELDLLYGKGLIESERKKGEFPVFGSNGIVGYHEDYLVKAPGIIIGRKGSVGEIRFSNQDFFPIDTTYYVNLKNNNDIKFFYYFLLTLRLNEMNSHSAVPGLNRNDVYSMDISLPPLSEQKAIAGVLSSLDDKIDLLHRQNKTLEALAETLFRQWFIEEANESWVQGKLPDEFDFVMGSSPPGESYNEIGVGIPMFQGNADFEFRFPKKRIYTTDPKRFAEKYDTLVSVRAPVGEQNMAKERCCIGRGVSAFRYKNDSSFYSYTYFKMKSLMEEIKQFNETGTVFGSISKSDFENLEITIPPQELVVKFQSEVKSIDDKIITNSFQINTLEKLRDTLLPKLMSGEVQVTL